MNGIDELVTHMKEAFTAVGLDPRLHASHVNLYLSILALSMQQGFENPVSISRNALMHNSKVGSKTTYHRCIKELEMYGYIRYLPNYNSYVGTKVELLALNAEMPAKMLRLRSTAF